MQIVNWQYYHSIPVTSEWKFLGVIFDSKLSFLPTLTDSSNEDNRAALAVTFPSKSYSQKLTHNTPIYTAELLVCVLKMPLNSNHPSFLAMKLALQYIKIFY